MKTRNSILISLALFTSIALGCKSDPKPCDIYDQTLNGYFASSLSEGTWRFSGGKAGTITIRGLDYNDMDCGYQITNCLTGDAHMNCEGAGLDKAIRIISVNEIEVGDIKYKRVSGETTN